MPKIEKLKFDFKQQLSDPDVLEIRLYGEVCGDRVNWWNGQVTESKTSQDYFAEKLDEYKDVKKIILYINSEGGSVEHGYGIYANLKRHPAQKTCYVDGFANSIASIIAMACDKIIMYPNSIMGIHNVLMPVYGNAAELRKAADDLDRIMEGNREIYLQRSNGKITLEKLNELLDDETLLTATQCLEYGFCDEVDSGHKADDSALEKASQNLLENAQERLAALKSIKESMQSLDKLTPKPNGGSVNDNFAALKTVRESIRALNEQKPTPAISGDDIFNCMMGSLK